MRKTFFIGIGCLLMLGVVLALPASAQLSESKTTATAEPAARYTSPQFGGSNSVGGTLKKDHKSEAMFSFKKRNIQDYFDFKKQVEEQYGFAFGFDYNALYQAATESLGDDHEAGAVLRIFGQWTAIGRGSENTGTLVYKVENRHRIGTGNRTQEFRG